MMMMPFYQLHLQMLTIASVGAALVKSENNRQNRARTESHRFSFRLPFIGVRAVTPSTGSHFGGYSITVQGSGFDSLLYLVYMFGSLRSKAVFVDSHAVIKAAKCKRWSLTRVFV